MLQASGGDDYELCFTAPLSMRVAVAQLALATGTPVTRIGQVVEGRAVQGFDADGQLWQPSRRGYRHFDQT